VQELWESKKRLQLKAHTYSDHADKLKRFISDKLLEYIEYDEKFLHFKSIAAEVRHNGVISFDKVQTTLQRIEDEADTPKQVSDVRAARDAMRYLWDLLDPLHCRQPGPASATCCASVKSTTTSRFSIRTRKRPPTL